MKSMLYYGKTDLRAGVLPIPELRPNSVRIKVEWTGICGTDLHEYEEGPIFAPTPEKPHPLTGESIPIVLGHEISGRIDAIHPDIDRFEVGEAVCVEPIISCGECRFCNEDRFNLCVSAGYHGLSGWGGGFAEYVVVDAKRVHALGDIPTDIGALVEPLATAYHAVRRSNAQPGDAVVVFGAGPIGLFITAILRAIGIDDVVSVEISAVRKQKAHEAGAILVLDPTEDDVVARVHERTGGLGADVTFECVGKSTVLQNALDATRSGGTLTNVAIWADKAPIDLFSVVMREIDVVGTSAYCNDHQPVIKLIQEGKIDPGKFITGRVPLADVVERGFKQLLENREHNVKILVHP